MIRGWSFRIDAMINDGAYIRILFIAGAMRSGSTLLGMMLGALPGFFNVGEMKWFWRNATREQTRCGCGSTVQKCSFWSEVIRRLAQRHVDIAHIAAIQPRLGRTADMPFIWLRKKCRRKSGIWQEFTSAHQLLYLVTSEVAGGDVIVDGSKLPPHLMLLESMKNVDVRTIHLVRDGRGVAWSWEKRHRGKAKNSPGQRGAKRSAYKGVGVWLVQNLLLEYMLRNAEHCVRARYEDLVEHRDETLLGILHALGMDSGTGSTWLAQDNHLPLSHSLGGSNEVRFKTGPRELVNDEAWKKNLTATQKHVSSAMALPLLRRYGYAVNDRFGRK